MDFLSEEFVKVELAERVREADRLGLVAAARQPRLPLRVRIGLSLMAWGERVGGERVRSVAGASTLSRPGRCG